MTSTNSVHLRLVPVARPLVSDRGHVAGRPFGSAAAASVCSVRRLRRALYAKWFISSLKSARESVLLPFWRQRMETYGGDDFPPEVANGVEPRFKPCHPAARARASTSAPGFLRVT